MGDDGYTIGFKELYDQLTRLDSKLDAHLTETAVKLATHDARLAELENAAAKRWQFTLTRITAAAALIAAVLAAVLPILLHK